LRESVTLFRARTASERLLLLLNQSPHALTEQYLQGIDKKVGGTGNRITSRRKRRISAARITNQSMCIRKSCGLMLKIIPFASFSRPP